MPLISRHTGRPIVLCINIPGVHRQECDFGRTESKPQGIIKIEISQHIRTDCGLCALRSLTFLHGNKFRRKLRCQNGVQGLRDVVAELRR